MNKEQDIVKRLAPTHLTEEITHSTEQLKKEVEAATSEPTREPPTPDDPRAKREYPFDFKWKSPNGKLWKGHFVNKILSIADRQNVGLMRARLGGGMPSDSLDGFTHEINLIIAHLTYSLVESPDWAQDLRELNEVPLIQALYMEVASHEATFFGLGADQTGSKD